MAIVAVCDCGGQQKLPNSYEGKEVKCLKCGNMIRVGVIGAALSERRLQAGDVTLVARCEPQLEAQADAVLRRIVAQHSGGVGLTDRVKISFGWSELQLQRRGSELLVCEADYTRNPWSDVREDISLAINIGRAQAELAKKVSVKVLLCTFSQSIQTAAGCLAEEEILMWRIRKPKPEDSGWFIGPVDQERLARVHEQGDYDPILSYQLVSLRPELIPALILPMEFKVHFRGKDMISVKDGYDNELLPPQ
jgi:hypothetical protein